MLPNPQFPTDLVTFPEEILNGKLHFLCTVRNCMTNSCKLYALPCVIIRCSKTLMIAVFLMDILNSSTLFIASCLSLFIASCYISLFVAFRYMKKKTFDTYKKR